MTTTPSFEGRRIARYLGIVSGDAIVGANIFKDLFARVRDIVGGRSATYEREFGRARENALDELGTSALALGANGVVGVAVDHEIIGQSMLMVAATGTAVVFE